MQKVNPELTDELFLNTPERILENIKIKQKEILEANKFIAGLKLELEAHYKQGNIMSHYDIESIKAHRRKKPAKWHYSPELEDEIARANKFFAEKKEYEQQEDIAKKEPSEYIWIVK